MVQAGLVERLPNPADRRGVLVSATKAGRKVFERVASRVREYHCRQWADLTDEDHQELIRILGVVTVED
jgi:DNA-binding MarR family transcriptional regulator